MLLVLAFIASRATARSALEFFTVGVLIAIVAGGVVFFLAQWVGGTYLEAGGA